MMEYRTEANPLPTVSSGLPACVCIGAITYTVKEIQSLRADDGEELLGHIRHNSGEILLEESMTPEMKVAVLWHEIVHGLMEQAGISDHPEQIVVAFGYGMVRLLKDNPGLGSA